MGAAKDGGTAVELGWRWDPTLYRGSADHYATGRVAYPSELVRLLAEELRLDGRQRLLDIGWGPVSLVLALAPHFREVIGVDADADADMLAVAARSAGRSPRGQRSMDVPARRRAAG